MTRPAESAGLSIERQKRIMTSFQTYLLGFIILVIGLALAAYLLGAPPLWIAVGAVVMIGIGIITATSNTQPRDPQQPPP